MTEIITALYHAASSEELDTMDGPSLCDYYQRREGSYGVSGLRKRLQAGPGAVCGGDLMNKEERRQRAEKFRQEREREA